MLQQKVSEPTRNSLQKDQDEAASGQGFLDSVPPPTANSSAEPSSSSSSPPQS